MDSLESIGRELRDLRGDFIGVKRAMGRGRRDEASPRDLAQALICQAACALFHFQKRRELLERFAQKAATSPAMTSIPTWAAELVGSSTLNFILSLSSGIRAFPSIMAKSHVVPLTEANSRLISLAGGASASFTGEGQPIRVIGGTLTAATLLPRYVKAISSYSEELADRSEPEIESVLRQTLSNAIGAAIEVQFFSASAGSAEAPAGILAGKSAIAPGDSFPEDVRNLMSAVDPPASPIFAMSPARKASAAASGSLLGFGDYEVTASSEIPDDRLILINGDGLAIGVGGQPRFTPGEYGTIHEEDTTPLPLATGAQGSAVVATPIRSLWQTDNLGLRSVLPVTWGIQPTAVAYVDDVAW